MYRTENDDVVIFFLWRNNVLRCADEGEVNNLIISSSMTNTRKYLKTSCCEAHNMISNCFFCCGYICIKIGRETLRMKES